MELYWKNTPIRPGTVMEVVEYGNDVYSEAGTLARVTWKVLEINERKEGEDYYELSTGKCYPLRRVIERSRLQHKSKKGELVQIPASRAYLVLREYHNGTDAGARCFSLDMLSVLKEVRIIG